MLHFLVLFFKMHSAALGVTCQDAFVVFSQHETLRLQSEVSRLQARLIKFEPLNSPFHVFETLEEFVDAEQSLILLHVQTWLLQNVHACSFRQFEDRNINALFDIYNLRDAISRYVESMTSCKQFADHLADKSITVVGTACDTAFYMDIYWCEDQYSVFRVVWRCLEDFLHNELIGSGAIDWKDDII
jgi:hypothetical protein